MAGMGSFPEWAPRGQSHLLRSTSIVNHVAYGVNQVAYTTFDSDSTEVLRLGFPPGHVIAQGETLEPRSDLKGPGWTFDSRTGVIRIRHVRSKGIQVSQ
jgi:hypothetical protein